MKTTKRFAGVLLALLMLFAVTTTAFASADGSITVSNPVKDELYTAYKIFDVVYSADKTAFSYSISGTSEWYPIIKDYHGLVFKKIPGENRYIVERDAVFSAADFAKTLKGASSGKTGTPLTTQGDGSLAATGLELGYYFVSSVNGALCNLTTTKPAITITDKNDVPFIKTDDKQSVEIGEIVNYTITGKVPDTTGFTSYDYIINDTMSSGLTFNKNVSISIGGTVLDAGKYELNQTTNGFTLTIKVIELQDKIGQQIEVTYTATVNENAVSVVSKNSATLTYSNDPTNKEHKTTTPADEETVYSAKIVINKFDKDKPAKKLSGAKFLLKNSDNKYYKYIPSTAETPASVTWITDKSAATELTTDTNGAAEFPGLKDGSYKLEETAAPAGYNILTSDVSINIDGRPATKTDISALIATANVENSTGSILPETGGMGTTVFYVLGGFLAVAAVVLLITRKRMNAAK